MLKLIDKLRKSGELVASFIASVPSSEVGELMETMKTCSFYSSHFKQMAEAYSNSLVQIHSSIPGTPFQKEEIISSLSLSLTSISSPVVHSGVQKEELTKEVEALLEEYKTSKEAQKKKEKDNPQGGQKLLFNWNDGSGNDQEPNAFKNGLFGFDGIGGKTQQGEGMVDEYEEKLLKQVCQKK